MVSSECLVLDNIRSFKFGYSPIGNPFLFVHIYFIDGLLIDTGQPKARKTILNTLDGLKVDQIFLTHYHEDHSGNAPSLSEKFQCPVYSSTKCSELMKAPPPLSFAQQVFWGNRPANTNIRVKNHFIETSNYNFRLIPIPGHAEDMVALYEADKGWLFSADLYVNSYIGYFLKNESVTQQIESIKRILKLDFSILFCSHNPRLNDGREKLQKKLDYLEEFNGQIIAKYEEGLNAKQIFKSLNLKEHGFTYLLSHGELSKMNMVKSVIRDYETSL